MCSYGKCVWVYHRTIFLKLPLSQFRRWSAGAAAQRHVRCWEVYFQSGSRCYQVDVRMLECLPLPAVALRSSPKSPSNREMSASQGTPKSLVDDSD